MPGRTSRGSAPTTPLNYRAGWGFLVLTNMLPNQGNGTFNLHMNAIDLDGQRGALGSRTIVAQNSTAVEPFGAIDTPGQGETISGTNYANFGWVLSRVRRADPPGGGSVFVYIDGVAVGSPGGWNVAARSHGALPRLSGHQHRARRLHLQHARLRRRPPHDCLGRGRQ